MIAHTRQVLDERLIIPSGETRRIRPPAISQPSRDIEVPVVKHSAGPRSAPTLSDFSFSAALIYAEQLRRRPYFTVGVARFNDVQPASVIKNNARWKRQSCNDCFDSVALRHSDIKLPDYPLSIEDHPVALPAASGAAHPIAGRKPTDSTNMRATQGSFDS
jgi:hypothetical protein